MTVGGDVFGNWVEWEWTTMCISCLWSLGLLGNTSVSYSHWETVLVAHLGVQGW